MSKSVVLTFLTDLCKTIHSIVYARTSNKWWLRLACILAIVLFLVIIQNKQNLYEKEGFSQNTGFISKEGNAIYDEFYCEKYDLLMKPRERALFETNSVIEMTKPSNNSIFLDVGSGTGHLVNNLQKKGYLVYGIEKSPHMAKTAEKTFPESNITVNDVLDPMAFEHNTFSHILCMGGTIYELENKAAFFKNCYHWLVPNGYVILHLIDRNKFDPIIPISKHTMIINPQKNRKNRITNTDIDFKEFSYNADYVFPENNSTIIVKERFSDNMGKIRRNENVLYVDPIEQILQMAMTRGFIVHSKVTMSKYNDDENQYIYVLERAM